MNILGAPAVASMAVLTILAGCSSEQDAGSAAAFDVAARNQPSITSVTTDDGFTQVRQNSSATLVIKGKKLGHTTSVTVGDLIVNSIDSVKPHEVRISVLTFGFKPLGPTDVTVTSTDGTAVARGAIELTPFVISPTAVIGGHGTFQSPLSLCDPSFAGFPDVSSTVLLLAGTHRCGQLVFLSGGTIAGDPDQPTIITGTDEGAFDMSVTAFGGPVTIRDLTFAQPVGRSIDFTGGELHVERVIDAGGGITAGFNDVVTIDHYSYEGEGNAIDIASGEITNTTIRHCGAASGIVARGGNNGGGVTIDHTVVEDCDIGIELSGPGGFERVGGGITSSQLLDNGFGISARFANLSVRDTVIRGNDATPRVSSVGIAVGSGNTELFDLEITGQQAFGIGISHSSSDGQDAVVSAGNLLITGGQFGIGISGIDNNLSVHHSIIRDQTAASVAVDSVDGFIDISNNQLSVISGFCIDDSRFFESGFNHFLFADGTTLNGVSFDGQSIDGPAELAPYYHIASDSGIQF